MKKKILSLTLVVCLLAIAVVGGTLAYFTDTDAAKNVMTMGNVNITQLEKERNAEGELVPFQDDKPLMPMVDLRKDQTLNPVVNGWFDEAMKNVVDKVISVKNDGTTTNGNYDAYVRTLIAFEGRCDVQGEYIGKLWNKKAWTVAPVPKVIDGVEQPVEVKDGDRTLVNAREVMINGEVHTVYEVIYKANNGVLPANVETEASLKQIFLAPTANNEVAGLFGADYTIYAVTQAVQVDGFTDAEAALDAAFGDPMKVSDQVMFDWFKGVA